MNNDYLISVDIEPSFFQQSYFLNEKPSAKVLQLMTVDLGAKFFSRAEEKATAKVSILMAVSTVYRSI